MVFKDIEWKNYKGVLLPAIPQHQAVYLSKEEQKETQNDLTLPVDWHDSGARHPVSIIKNQIIGSIMTRVSSNWISRFITSSCY